MMRTAPAVATTSTALDARNLYRFFHAGDDETLALRGVSLAVERGELVAVTGPSGSGKSTLLACLAGLDDPDGGAVHIDGELMSRRAEPARAALRARSIGMLFQSNNLLDHLTVRANVALTRQLVRAGDRSDADSVDELLDRLGIAGRARAYPSQLSGGEAARAGLAVALVNRPPVLLADEPTGELDSVTAAIVLDELCRHAEAGSAVVVVTHSAAVADRAERVVRLRDGQVVS